MSDEIMQKDSGNSTMLVDIGIGVIVVVTGLLAISPSTRPLAIAVGGGIPAGLGVVVLLWGMISNMLTRGKASDQDFSSFAPAEERNFVGHERLMRSNESRANLIGFGAAGGMFLLGLLITVGLYSPCTNFCDHAPPTCKDNAIAAWKASCESQCAVLERASGLQVLKLAAGQEGSTEKEKKMEMQPVSGAEYVQALSACSFAGGNGPTCEKVVEKATSMGLWCPEH
jgi:hypothetical protein